MTEAELKGRLMAAMEAEVDRLVKWEMGTRHFNSTPSRPLPNASPPAPTSNRSPSKPLSPTSATLLAAASDKKKIVDDAAVRKAINDLEHD